jgi:hypothetical protein
MSRHVLIARPRLDCSFKKGPIPEAEGPPRTQVLANFGRFIDGLADYHRARGDKVTVETRALWQFELEDMQKAAKAFDAVYFPHRQKRQYPIGDNALYYMATAFPDYVSVDPVGWGASMSWIPLAPGNAMEHRATFEMLRSRVTQNVSKFVQPALGRSLPIADFLLFVCQIPHDETIQFHSAVSVPQALAATLAYGRAAGRRVVVKGHPVNRESMRPLRQLVEVDSNALWVDDISIHTCLAGAERVFLVNSGVGFEAMLHDRTVIRFGEAEYASVAPKAECSADGIARLDEYRHSHDDYVGFLGEYLARCVRFDDPASYRQAFSLLGLERAG